MTRNLCLLLAIALLTGCFSEMPRKDYANPSESKAPSPVEVTRAYWALIREGRSADAVRTYFDAAGFAERIYGSDWDALTAGKRRSVADEHVQFLIEICSDREWKEVMERIEIDQLTAQEQGEFCVVRFVAKAPEQPGKSQKMLLHRAAGQWRIVDLGVPGADDFSSADVRRAYLSTGIGPLEYVQGMRKWLARETADVEEF